MVNPNKICANYFKTQVISDVSEDRELKKVKFMEKYLVFLYEEILSQNIMNFFSA